MVKTPFLLCSCAILLAFRCGKPALNHPPTNPGFGLNDEPGADEEVYQWDDPQCISNAKLGVALSKFDITSWDEPQAKTRSIDISGLLNSNGHIEGSQIGGSVLAREKYARSCKETVGNSPCTDASGKILGWLPSAPPQGIAPKFCLDSGQYRRDSIERITMSALHALHATREFVSKAYLNSKPTGPLNVQVVPRFETNRAESNSAGTSSKLSTSLIVDQVAYFPRLNSDQAPFIAIFPRRRGSTEQIPRLWESNFVIGHEIGHHVERLLGVDHFQSTQSLVRAAVSEGFADMVGFSNQKLDDTALLNMPCLSDRAISKATFSDGVAKIIDKALMNALMLKESELGVVSFNSLTAEGFTTTACSPPLRVARHGLGAILAHIVFDFATRTFDLANVELTSRPLAFANFSKAWLKTTESSIHAGGKADLDVTAVARSIEKTVLDELAQRRVTVGPNISRALCQQIKLQFSGLPEQSWFGQQSCSSPAARL